MNVPVFRLLVAGVLLSGVSVAQADILKCKDSTGQVIYTQASCPPGATPLELPEEVTRDTGSSFARTESARPLSPRAQALKKKFDACMRPSSADCQEFTELGKFCGNRSNWESPDCAAYREVNANVVSELGRVSDRLDRRTRERCQEGDSKACDDIKCPISLLLDGSDADVRACSRHRSLPSTSSWAQVRDRTSPEGRWEGEYICLRMVEFTNPIGQRVSMRPSVKVRDAMQAGRPAAGYSVSSVRRETFATREQAIEAGCAAQSARIQSESPR